MSIDQIIDNVIAIEGDAYTNDPNDSGGPTKYGITLATLSDYRERRCTPEDVQALTRAEAFNVYKWLFVLRPRLDRVVEIAPAVGHEVVDTGVNLGATRAITILQRCLNAFNKRGTLYPDVDVDGVCGQATLDALRAYTKQRGSEGQVVLLKALNALQGDFYIDLAERRPKDEDYAYGWFKNRIGFTVPA